MPPLLPPLPLPPCALCLLPGAATGCMQAQPMIAVDAATPYARGGGGVGTGGGGGAGGGGSGGGGEGRFVHFFCHRSLPGVAELPPEIHPPASNLPEMNLPEMNLPGSNLPGMNLPGMNLGRNLPRRSSWGAAEEVNFEKLRKLPCIVCKATWALP